MMGGAGARTGPPGREGDPETNNLKLVSPWEWRRLPTTQSPSRKTQHFPLLVALASLTTRRIRVKTIFALRNHRREGTPARALVASVDDMLAGPRPTFPPSGPANAPSTDNWFSSCHEGL